jgi:PAP2 superfamily
MMNRTLIAENLGCRPILRSFVYCWAVFVFFVCNTGAYARGGQTILTYPSVSASTHAELVHKSVFHSEQTDAVDADRILNRWEFSPVSVPWTQMQLELHVKHKVSPSRAARGLALTHVAMHDAYQLTRGMPVSERRLAVSMAAAQVLGYLFVPEERRFERVVQLMAELMLQSGGIVDQKVALSLGRLVAGHVIQWAEQDGAQKGWNGLRLEYYGQDRYYGAGTWEPTPPYHYYPPDEPFAPTWKTWVLKSPSEFRTKPLPYGSPKYIKELQEVMDVTLRLTDEEKRVAQFWVDGHGTVTPAGHWNQIALEHVLGVHLNDEKALDLFARLNMALADTFVAAWDAKYYYWTTRPVTAAHKLLGKELRPFLLTPPFPSYVSGHAAFSGAAAQVISKYFRARSQIFEKMAKQAAYSRLLGGIHFRHDNEDGLKLGKNVATKVLNTKWPIDRCALRKCPVALSWQPSSFDLRRPQ